MRRRVLSVLSVLSVPLLLLAGCGDDDDTAVGVDDTITTEAPESQPGDEPDDTELGDDSDQGDDRVDPDADRARYTGGYTVDFDTGIVDVSAYAAFLAEHGPPSTGAEGAALELLDNPYVEEPDGEGQPDPDVSSIPADGGRTVVTVVYEGLMDDSVAAERFELVFVGEADQMRLESGSWASRCQQGRGHQDFSIGFCV